MGFKFEEKSVNLKCTECGQDYEDTQTIVNGVPSYKFHICPECQRKFEKVLKRSTKLIGKGDRK